MVVLLAQSQGPASAPSALQREAAAYARNATLAYEWEGYPDGPLSEAKFANDYLAAHEHTVLRPYLELFLLDRYRAAFEAAVYEIPLAGAEGHKGFDGPTAVAQRAAGYAAAQRLAAAKYREVWTRLATTTDPVVRAIADEIDGVAFIYLNVGVHPRHIGTMR